MQRRKRDSKSKKQSTITSPPVYSSSQSSTLKIDKKWIGKTVITLLAIGMVWIVFRALLSGWGERTTNSETKTWVSKESTGASSTEGLPPSREEARPAETKSSGQILQVEVLNGCGAPGVGSRFTDFLRSRGYDVVKTDNADNWNYPQTVVIDRRGDMNKANELADQLGAKKVIQQIETTRLLDLSVIIGKDFKKLNIEDRK